MGQGGVGTLEPKAVDISGEPWVDKANAQGETKLHLRGIGMVILCVAALALFVWLCLARSAEVVAKGHLEGMAGVWRILQS